MTIDFKAMKANRANRMDALKKELSNAGKKTTFQKDDDDPTFWKLTVDKAGNGFAIIRFLDSASELPYTTYWDHGFQGPGGYYIEKSLTSLKQPDPVAELNSKLWKAGDKATARKQKRRLHHVANILVVKDGKNPENEGKVFKFKFGVKIMEKLNEAMVPPFDEEGRTPDDDAYNPVNAFNPFDYWEGANLKLAARKVEGYRNYDSSEFLKQDPLAASDEQIQEIVSQAHDLSYILDPSNFKTYEELASRLAKVTNSDSVSMDKADMQTKESPSAGKTKEAISSGPSTSDEELNIDDIISQIENEGK